MNSKNCLVATSVQHKVGLEYADKLTDDCIRVQIQDREKAKRRCLKKTYIDGNKICCFPPYPTSHKT